MHKFYHTRIVKTADLDPTEREEIESMIALAAEKGAYLRIELRIPPTPEGHSYGARN